MGGEYNGSWPNKMFISNEECLSFGQLCEQTSAKRVLIPGIPTSSAGRSHLGFSPYREK